MLKKLVRYGNSNALVLDKAILELLNIAEGSVVKISTDGRSIILTPAQEAVSKVIETMTSQDAMIESGVQLAMDNYNNLSVEQKVSLRAELLALMKKHTQLMESCCSNEQFVEEMNQVKVACGDDKVKFMELYKQVRNKYVPELPVIEEAMTQFHEKCKILSGDKPTQNLQEVSKDAEREMAAVFEKHKNTQASVNNFVASPEYQHKAQLITEKFQGNLNSAEFMQEMKQLMYEFCPEMEQMHKELQVIDQKYYQK